MANETPAEKMHNRILNGTWFWTEEVPADEFEALAQRAGTLGLLDVKSALDRLRRNEKEKEKQKA